MSGYLGKALTQFVILVAFARISGAHGAGEFAFALAVCTPVFAITELALRNILQTLSDPPPFRSFFAVRVATTVFALLLIAIPAGFVNGFPPANIMIPILVMRAADSVLDICFGGLQGEHRVGMAAAWMWVNTALTLVVIGISMGVGARASVAIEGSAVASVVVLLALAPRMLKGHTRWFMSRNDARRVLRAGATLGVAQGCESLLIYLPTLYLTRYDTKAAVGLFAVCQYTVTLSNMGFSSIMQTALSYLRRTLSNDGAAKLVQDGLQTGASLLGLGCAAAVFSIGVYPYLVPPVFGDQFDVTTTQMVPLGLAVIVLSTEYATTTVQLVLNRYQSRVQASLLGFGLVLAVAVATFSDASVASAGWLLFAGLLGRAAWSAVSLFIVLRDSAKGSALAPDPDQQDQFSSFR